MCLEQVTLDQLTLFTLIIPQVHFNCSSASSIFLTPFSTFLVPSLDPPLPCSSSYNFPVVQKNLQVYILSFSEPKPSHTPQNNSSDHFLWLHLRPPSNAFILTPDERFQTGQQLLFYITSHSFLHFSHFSPSHSLCRSGSRALPFSIWWESCFIYTLLFFIFLFLYLHLPSNLQHFPLNLYFRSCISVGNNAMMASIKHTQFSDFMVLFKIYASYSLFFTGHQILDLSLSLTDCPHFIHWAPDSYYLIICL